MLSDSHEEDAAKSTGIEGNLKYPPSSPSSGDQSPLKNKIETTRVSCTVSGPLEKRMMDEQPLNDNSNNPDPPQNSGSPAPPAEASQSTPSHGDIKREDKGEPFDCNVCFDLAQDPVVTRCGHLYCWPCLVSWLKHHQECPVCKARVTQETVIPIYGQGTNTVDPRTKDIPQRPRPERVEAPRRRGQQQQNNNNVNWNIGLFTGSSLAFSVFPFGIGVTWPTGWFTGQDQGQTGASREEVVSQLLSMAFLFIAIFVTLGIIFVGDSSPEF
eukprot:Blabericola_migrator_1__2184@NODE_1601_length_4192_cov_84_630788_g231_i2_p2_GENE_NODE_1601_length_4192_cov_84_630788_g231_i2NODE_1601_length_4192_cov_84_630788_g231_i2_p2_ORF_typecomplete_len270_score39_20zfC3HC4_2/PF13923_6/1_2e14zfC3HC4_3/PF13920_6/6_8e13ProkRING_4/PF14447_6/2_1e11zfC3HC4/PF00097_25/9_5e11zfRING_5/PF14634_6/4_9e09zfC3HC4_4/PF15227_6/1_4e08Ubox/PF04564_15/5_2e08zfRING_UBOX/PF13445_6/6_6e08zfRING_UBOX/PF13445_6/3_5e02zfRING_2/PF13639_6/1_6e07zfrbx1/PF12678_7/3_4e06zfRING_6/PF148